MVDDIVFSGNGESSRLTRLVHRGELRRLGVGVYTSSVGEPAEAVCRRNWSAITAHFCPGAVIVDRSARMGQPDLAGNLFVVANRVKRVELPGLTIVPRRGPGALPDDMAYPHGLWMSSVPRALVENQRPSRAVKGRPSRTLGEAEVADWVDSIVRSYDDVRVAKVRQRSAEIAEQFGLAEQGRRADRLIGAALQTQRVPTGSASLAARQSGLAFDPDREALFDCLFDALDRIAPMTIVASPQDTARRRTLPFWDAYFSNFIEGTEFTVDEAIGIVYEREIPRGRPADAHDILDTYRVVADDDEMGMRPSTFEEFEELLLRRHRLIMLGRPESGPGEYKEAANRAGSTFFVRPELVRGSLIRGWDRLARLASPAHRGFFSMFVVSEVHPFTDGNGRTARVMMNAELYAGGEMQAIIPVIYRNEYLAGLRRLSRQGDADLLIRVLAFARRYVAAIDFSTVAVAREQLGATNAFVPADEALTRGLYLVLPGPGPSAVAARTAAGDPG